MKTFLIILFFALILSCRTHKKDEPSPLIKDSLRFTLTSTATPFKWVHREHVYWVVDTYYSSPVYVYLEYIPENIHTSYYIETAGNAELSIKAEFNNKSAFKQSTGQRVLSMQLYELK